MMLGVRITHKRLTVDICICRYLSVNEITSIPANTFSTLTALSTISLYENRITNIHASAFTGLSALTILDLFGNELTSLSANTFTSLTALTQLFLSGNRFTIVPTSVFTGLNALTQLDLYNNQFTSIPANAFTDLTALTQLYLYNNLITSVSATAFAGLTSLIQLFLHNNQITSLSATTFTGLTAVTTLTLNNNAFTTLPPGLFKGLLNGMSLSVSGLSLNPNNFTSGGNSNPPPSTYGSASYPYKCDTTCATCYGSGSIACCGINCLTCTVSDSCTQCYEGYTMMGGSCISLASSASAASVAATRSASVASAASASIASVASAATIASTASVASVASTQSATAASIASIASTKSASIASAASIASSQSATMASAASLASTASASIASIVSAYAARASSASVASDVSATSALSASAASTASASAASTASASAASVASSIAQHGGGGGSQDSSSSSAAVIAAVVACVVVVAIIAAVFIVMRRRRSQRRSGTRPKDSTGPIHQEAIEMTISPLIHSPRAQKEEDIAAYAVVGQKQPEPLYQAISTASTSKEVVYDYASAYVAGSNSRRIREGLTIVKHLASGNFGDVALGQLPFSVLPPRAQNLLGPAASEIVQVAVKSLKSNADEKSRKDFESEAKLMAPFVHTNVVRLLAALVESEPHLVLLEFVQYGDLRTLLQKSKLHSLWWTQNEQIHAIRQIALGMEYLGTLHFVHRDLAARNCLVGKGMVVKIADFGLSRELASENDYYRMQTRGKLPVKWMAPETMTFRKFSTMSDVWSFGVTAWECSSYGAPPYGKMEGRDTLAHVEAGGRLPQPEHCSADLFNLMLSCWNVKPELRPSFSQLVKVLNTLEDGSVVREIGAML
ncbi:TKL protein kinase, variant 2 [Capsaspora owczarzaki ATCC 30864]|uniref:TKL protein kinase, variant 2 n=1 Tax=Capsaspora owczarzaki (strain ATCC 30864) TaxID=595528 RepID=A0A0D2WW64_CAPO3|nr:TKL protein kinase, variant 2 [Capsaspora owczarzaki ATCC 30864]